MALGGFVSFWVVRKITWPYAQHLVSSCVVPVYLSSWLGKGSPAEGFGLTDNELVRRRYSTRRVLKPDSLEMSNVTEKMLASTKCPVIKIHIRAIDLTF